MSQSQRDAFQSMQSLLDRLDAAEKQAEANTEAGGYSGSTTHPVKDVDDRTDDAQEGSRSAENSSDVKADQGAVGVESASEGFPGGQDSVQTNIGLQSKGTGDDPTNEDDYKATKDDPGSTHPARTDNNSLDGHKYSAFNDLRSLTKQANDLGMALLADIAVDCEQPADKQAAAKKPANAAQQQKEAAQAGYDLAGIFADMDIPVSDKQASDAAVVDTLDYVLSLADLRAEKTAQFYHQLFTTAQKQAESDCESEDSGEEKEEGEGDSGNFPEGGGGEDAAAAPAESAPPVAEGGDMGGGGGDEELAALLGGGAEMGGDEAMSGMAGGGDAAGGLPDAAAGMPPAPPMGGDAGGMPPVGGGEAGGMPPMGGEMGGDMAGGGDAAGLPPGDPTMGNEEALMMVLQQLGIPPEQLQQLMAGKMASIIQEKVAEKMASEVKAKSKSKQGPKTAGDLALLRTMTSVVKEIAGRN